MSTSFASARRARRRRWLVVAEVVLIGLVGTWLGLLAGGRLDASVGPLRTELSVAPDIHGGSVVAIPPLGRLKVGTHAGPWQLDIEVTRINARDARRIFNDPRAVNGLGEQVTHDLRGAAVTVVVRSIVAALAGAVLLGVLVFRRRWRRVLASTAVSASVLLAGGAVAALTWNPDAINEPEYDGLLASAPGLVGDARSIVANFAKYEDQLARLVTNVSRLYDVTSTLPAYQPDPSTVRVLFVSDLHINPGSWDVIRSVTEQFRVDLIVDAGDITDHGTAAENAYVEQIATLGVPYVWVRGNHDSTVTQLAIDSLPNAVVLDSDEPVEVEGLRFLGRGDPRFTPDKETRDQPAPESVIQVGREMAAAAGAQPQSAPVDVVVVHDPEAGLEVDGAVPLALSGHYHRRHQEVLPDGTLQFLQGSTGGSGLRALEREKPTPVQASVLYFDRTTGSLQAWDDITLGGLGLVSAKIERRVVGNQFPELAPTVSPTPTPSVTDSTTPSATSTGSATNALAPPPSVPYAFRVPDG